MTSSTKPVSKVVVLGARGMLGSDLCPVLGEGREVFSYDLEDGDITDPAALGGMIREIRPGWVVNCAAFTDVDGAESRQEDAYRVNRDGAANAAAAAREAGARLIHISTDFVFDGEKKTPYREEDEPNPLGVYGRSKWEGEVEVGKRDEDAIIVRTSWTFGAGGANFVHKILDLAGRESWVMKQVAKQIPPGVKAMPHVKVVSDQIGSPTYTLDLSLKLREMMDADLPGGIYHVTNAGSCTRSEEAERILDFAGLGEVRVDPVPSSFFRAPAARPKNSVLENAALRSAGIPLLRPWEEALSEYIASRECG
jgi:dTDP-4-dehydrorhamnose reductase